uniref:Triple gene block protein 1 n=1 Tax=Blackberry calico virus TaxID=3069585 RepID=A0AA50DE65_9VIRU|nr:triple gene block protein 1 [Blackberry calico virus]
MKIDDLHFTLLAAGFTRTNTPLTFPLVVHGVPGSGKSRLVRSLIQQVDAVARTCGAPYGASLTTPGVLQIHEPVPDTCSQRILDEYQLATPEECLPFNVLVGDPFQGTLRKTPHYVKEQSHRVPSPIAQHLRQEGFQITSSKPGCLIVSGPYHTALSGELLKVTLFLHLGQVSKRLTHSHGICSKHPTEVQGLEFKTVAFVYHSSEKTRASDFFVGCTRATDTLILISDEFHEFRTST